MAKTKEELNGLKQEYEILKNKLKELTEDELGYVVGGKDDPGQKYMDCPFCKSKQPVSAGLPYKGLPTYVCNVCGGLMNTIGLPLDPSVYQTTENN